MRKLTDRIFFVQDTCSVYGITANDKTLLIDCGTSPTTLETNGVQAVDQMLLTHFHRDTCSAAAHWKGAAHRSSSRLRKTVSLRRQISSRLPTIFTITTPPTIPVLVLWRIFLPINTLTTMRACHGREFVSM